MVFNEVVFAEVMFVDVVLDEVLYVGIFGTVIEINSVEIRVLIEINNKVVQKFTEELTKKSIISFRYFSISIIIS